MRAAGVIIAIAGATLALRSALLLAGRGRPQRGPQPEFILAGPYTRLRNPLFLGLIIALLGIALTIRSITLCLAALVAAVAAHVWVTRVEEPRLRTRFGEAYREYLARVPRWVPRVVSRPDQT